MAIPSSGVVVRARGGAAVCLPWLRLSSASLCIDCARAVAVLGIRILPTALLPKCTVSASRRWRPRIGVPPGPLGPGRE